MLKKLINWYNQRFNKPYGIEVRVIEMDNGLYKISYTNNGNSILRFWHDYWSSLNDDVHKIVDGVSYFTSLEVANKNATAFYNKMVRERADKAAFKSKGKTVLRLN